MNLFAVVVFSAAGLLYPSLLLLAAFSRGRFGARTRAQLATATADALLVLVIVHRLLDWSIVPPAAWFLPVALVAVGVAGAVRRGPGLPAWQPARPVTRQRVGLGVHLGIVVALAVLLLWW